MKKKLMWVVGIFAGLCVLLLSSSILTTINERNKVQEQQKEIARAQKKAQQLTTRSSKEVPTSYRNKTGHIYYQTDSIWGKLVYHSAQRWNRKLGKKVLLASDTGQLVDLFITDNNLQLPQNMGTPIYAELTLNHLASINSGFIIDQHLTDKDVGFLMDAIFASALGVQKLSGQLFGNNAIKEETISKNNTDKIRKNRNYAIKHETYNTSLIPMKSELGDHGFVNYASGILLLPFMKKDSNLNTQKVTHIYNDAKKALVKKHRDHKVSVVEISAAGNKLSTSITTDLKSKPLPIKQIKRIDKRLTMVNTVTTIAGTRSSIVADNGK